MLGHPASREHIWRDCLMSIYISSKHEQTVEYEWHEVQQASQSQSHLSIVKRQKVMQGWEIIFSIGPPEEYKISSRVSENAQLNSAQH